jgi:adenylate cyclase class 2
MQTEFEAKFLNVVPTEVRAKLTAIGAECVAPMRLMRRAIIDYPDRRLQQGAINAFIRVRDEGNKVTLTYKQFSTETVDGAEEIEVNVNSFEDTIAIFQAIGLQVHSMQESRREAWRMNKCEVVIDEWPWLAPFIEIEGESEQAVRVVAQELGYEWEHAQFGGVMSAYREQYRHIGPNDTVGTLPEVLFNAPLPDMFRVSQEALIQD